MNAFSASPHKPAAGEKSMRAKSVVIIEREGRYLFTVCLERTTGKVYYIPVGGGVHFGERSSAAAKREALEETGRDVTILQLLDVSENIFSFNGVAEHEIVFVYRAEFDEPINHDAEIVGNADDNGNPITLVWATIEDIRNSAIGVYPFNLLDVLERTGNR